MGQLQNVTAPLYAYEWIPLVQYNLDLVTAIGSRKTVTKSTVNYRGL